MRRITFPAIGILSITLVAVSAVQGSDPEQEKSAEARTIRISGEIMNAYPQGNWGVVTPRIKEDFPYFIIALDQIHLPADFEDKTGIEPQHIGFIWTVSPEFGPGEVPELWAKMAFAISEHRKCKSFLVRFKNSPLELSEVIVELPELTGTKKWPTIFADNIEAVLIEWETIADEK